MTSEFPTRSPRELSPNPATSSTASDEDALQHVFDELARDDYDADAYRLSAERGRQAYEAARRRLSDMVALATGKISTADYLQKHGQPPASPAVAADRQKATPVREISSPSPVSLASPTSVSSSPTPVSPLHRQLILDGRRRYRVARNVTENSVARPVAWKRLSETEIEAVEDQLLEDRGAFAFTLHISADMEAELLSAVRAGRKLTQVIADRMIRQFRKHGLDVPPFRFTVETSPHRFNRHHLHGAVLFGDLDAKQLVAARDCLRGCLGRIPGQSGSTQLALEDFYNFNSKWRRYASKGSDKAAEILGTDQLSYTSRRSSRSLVKRTRNGASRTRPGSQ